MGAARGLHTKVCIYMPRLARVVKGDLERDTLQNKGKFSDW